MSEFYEKQAVHGDGSILGLPLHSSIDPQNLGLGADPLGLRAGGKPVRNRPRRGRGSSYDGWFSSPKAIGGARFESLLERDMHTLIGVDPRIKRYAVQAHQLHFWMPGPNGDPIKRSYTPDIVAETNNGQVLILEVKAAALRSEARWAAREPFIRQAYAQDHGALFLVFTEAEIRVQPRLGNCQIIWSHRGPAADPYAELTLREILSGWQGELLLGQLCALAEERQVDRQSVFSAMMRIAMAGGAALDLSHPLGLSTRVTVGEWW